MNRVTTVHPVGSINRGISRGRRELEAETPEVLGEDGVNPNPRGGTSWSAWRAGQPSEQHTVGIEEELMLLDPRDWSLAFRPDELIPDLPSDLCDRVTLETHAAVIGDRDRRPPPSGGGGD
jgi:hypothetical protein